MAERVSDEKRLELVAMITSSYISAFNGPEMRPPRLGYDRSICRRYHDQNG